MAQLVEALRYKPEGRGFESRGCHWDFSLPLTFRPHYGPLGGSGFKTNEYQGHLLGVNTAGAYGSQPCHLHCRYPEFLVASTSWSPRGLSWPV
jgi:hypothetical protein